MIPVDRCDLADLLWWVETTHPADTLDGWARIEITWDAWNEIRGALDLPSQYPDPECEIEA